MHNPTTTSPKSIVAVVFDECATDQPSMVHEDKNLSVVEKIDTIVLWLKKRLPQWQHSFIAHFDFVILYEYNDVEYKNFLFLGAPKRFSRIETFVQH